MNNDKYPADRVRGSSKKYNEYICYYHCLNCKHKTLKINNFTTPILRFYFVVTFCLFNIFFDTSEKRYAAYHEDGNASSAGTPNLLKNN